MQTIKQSILSIAIGLVALVAGISYAWTGAPGNPPTFNTPAPINAGTSSQTKTGAVQVNGFRNIGKSVFDYFVGIGTTEPTSLLDIKTTTSYIKSETFTCEAGDTAISYKTEPNTCGRKEGDCTKKTTGSHSWSATDTTIESITFITGPACGQSDTCYATTFVKCSKPAASLLKVVADEGLSIIDGTQGAGKVLTSDVNGKANWQTPTVVYSHYSITYGSLTTKEHNYCALSSISSSSSEDSQSYNHYVYPNWYNHVTGKYTWLIGHTPNGGYNYTTVATCFDFKFK